MRTIVFVMAVTAVAASAAQASLKVSIADSDGDPQAVTAPAGGSFTIDIAAETDREVATLEGGIEASADGVFALTVLNYGEGWNKPGSLIAYNFNPPVAVNPPARFGSGRSAANITGVFKFATLTVSVAKTAKPGEYRLKLRDFIAGGKPPGDVKPDSYGAAYVVTVPGEAVTQKPSAAPAAAEKNAVACAEPSKDGSKADKSPAAERPCEKESASKAEKPPPKDKVRRSRSTSSCGAGAAHSVVGSAIGMMCLLQMGRGRRRM